MGEEVISNLAKECLLRAGQIGAYIYIRALPSDLIEGEKKGRLFWKVQAELMGRGGEWKQWRSEGYDLDRAIRETVGQMPARAPGRKVVRRGTTNQTRTGKPNKQPRVGAPRIVRRGR